VLCELYGWTDDYVFQLPFLRVAMHLRNIQLRRKREREIMDNDPPKPKSNHNGYGEVWESGDSLKRLDEPDFKNSVAQL